VAAAAAIVLTGGAALPIVAAVVAAGAVSAAGTVGLNAYYDRPLGENVLRNGAITLVSGAATAGAYALATGGLVTKVVIGAGNTFTALCARVGPACARLEPALQAFDTGEQLWLSAQLAVQTATGDPRAPQTALELRLETMDGGVPGNTAIRELEQEMAEAASRRADDLADLPIESIPGTIADLVPDQYIEGVTHSFSDPPIAGSSPQVLVVYRYWGDGAEETGRPWFSPILYETPEEARRSLALPDSNSALNVSAFLVPADTPFLIGNAADMSSLPGFSSTATGGGGQIYLADPATAVLLRRIR